MTADLISFRKYLADQMRDVQDQLMAFPQADYWGPVADDLRRRFDEHLSALNLLNTYTEDIAESPDPQDRGKRTMSAYQVPREAPSHG